MALARISTDEALLLEIMWQKISESTFPASKVMSVQTTDPSEGPSGYSSPGGAPPPPGPKPLRRSRGGCQECRRLHRKCDEAKPVCGFCEQNKRECSYQKVLSWGGRPFGNSRFGSYIGKGAVKIANPATDPDLRRSFVYGTAAAASEGSSSATPGEPTEGMLVPLNAAQGQDVDSGVISTNRVLPFELSSIPGSLTWLPWLPKQYRGLLDHFAQSVVRLFVLDPQSVHDTCSAVIPMAVNREQSFHLLAAVLCLASTHQHMVGIRHNDSQVAHWKDVCIQHMQQRLNLPADETAKTTFAATALMLSMCDIVAGGEKPDTWRLHLVGALAVLDRQRMEKNHADDSYQRQILRLCKSLQMQTTMSEYLIPTSGSPCPCYPASILKQEGFDYIHEFHGFSTALSVILEDMLKLTIERHYLVTLRETTAVDDSIFDPLWSLMKMRSERLIKQVKYGLEHPITRLDPHLSHAASLFQCSEEYRQLNTAYHHITLLQIYSRVEYLPSWDPEVQEHVHRAMECVHRIEMRDHACPGVFLLQVLFAAGCEAEAEADRMFVDGALERWTSQYGTGNSQRGREFLHELWRRRDGLAVGEQLQWHVLIRELQWDLSLW